MNNGVNDTSNNQTIPGVKIAMPSDKPVDASTTDAGAALSNAKRVYEQSAVVSASPVQTPVTPTVSVEQTTVAGPSATAAVPSAPVVQPTVPVAQVQAVTAQPATSAVSAQTIPVIQPAASAVSAQTIPVIQPAASAVPAQTISVMQPAASAVPAQTVPVMQPAASAVPTQVVASENNTVVSAVDGNKKKEKKRKSKLSLFLIFVILLLGAACGFLWYYHQQEMAMMQEKCTPVSTKGETKKLDLDSTVVKDLYSKVSTTIREDLGGIELNDQLKLYLAYRQIATSDLYDSNCNKFSSISMEPFTCELTATFVPKAFKADVLQVELKKLFGEDTNIPNQNVQLGKTCIGGFQYIEERGEYVQGQCGSTGATLYRVEKELISATSTESIIVLTEKVKYYGAESLELPTKLISGTYKYTFKLDMNYNYIYVSKELAS